MAGHPALQLPLVALALLAMLAQAPRLMGQATLDRLDPFCPENEELVAANAEVGISFGQ